jgi:flagellar hook-associated protein 1 FlgK
MSLSTAMQIGRSALSASQLGLQVTGNNLANVSTPGYSRQIIGLAPVAGQATGLGGGSGRGVYVSGINRQIDSALMARLRAGISDDAGAQTDYGILSQLEATLGDLSSGDLSSQLTSFFKTWSERANLTKSSAVVVQQGVALAGYIRNLRSDMLNQRQQLDDQLGGLTEKANNLLEQIATLNGQISTSEQAGTPANALRDQRDQALADLSQIMDVTANEQPNGSVDVLVGSNPVVLGNKSRGLEFKRFTDPSGALKVTVNTKADGSQLPVTSGQLGSLLTNRGAAIDATLSSLDKITSELIYQVNRLHSTATNATGLSGATGYIKVASGDRSLPMNDPLNTTFASLPFKAQTGGFSVNVKDKVTGSVQTIRVNVDLDGITSAGTPGTADDTTPDQIRAALGAIPGLSAQWTSDGKLDIKAASGFEFSFSDDSSGVLATMGVNAYFTGTAAKDIDVSEKIAADPSNLMIGRMVNGTFVENGTALEIVKLQDASNASLGGVSIKGAWGQATQLVGVQVNSAKTRAIATSMVHESLESQRAAISGVSTDEESVNLMQFQRQYQAAAKVISTADELMQTLIALL